MKPLPFFPTPYPDELFYSVLCRYHLRCGEPTPTQTIQKLWGKRTAVNLLLPQSLGMIARRFPPNAELTAHYFAARTTIYPFLKPLLPKERAQRVLRLMESSRFETEQAYLVSGLPMSKSPKWQFLRYCEDCWLDDIRDYGEPYWHRLHQLPGVLVCPVHRKPVVNAAVFLRDTHSKFHAASFDVASHKVVSSYSNGTAETLALLAEDADWLLQNGDLLPGSEKTHALFDQLLRLRKFRSIAGGRSKAPALHAALLEYYGSPALNALGIDNMTVTPWSQQLFFDRDKLLYPMYYLLLMRFLAGSAKNFFTKEHGTAHPYGAGPWPCRNPVCPYYLQDVIVDLPMIQDGSLFRATFACPHCGFTYRRKQPLSKSKQYAGQITIVDRGPLWMETFRQLMENGTPYYRVAEALHCYFNTVKQLAVEEGFLSKDKGPPNTVYHYSYPKNPSGEPKEKPADYRQLWLQAMQENPNVTRSFLIHLHPAAYQWLRVNDREWYETNSPPPKRNRRANWTAKDEEHLAKAQQAVAYLRSLPGKPVWINRRAVEKFGSLNNIYNDLASGRLPKTKAYLDEVIESSDDWSKRKIRWAIEEMLEEGKPLYLPQIQIKASVTPETIERLADFVYACVRQLII